MIEHTSALGAATLSFLTQLGAAAGMAGAVSHFASPAAGNRAAQAAFAVGCVGWPTLLVLTGAPPLPILVGALIVSVCLGLYCAATARAASAWAAVVVAIASISATGASLPLAHLTVFVLAAAVATLLAVRHDTGRMAAAQAADQALLTR
ncbi:MAG: hypothetical protein HC809_07725 [Gammaproteobacteria bacterium]|nr:hypothetical protein [Gammaproteobacteria bacterium]